MLRRNPCTFSIVGVIGSEITLTDGPESIEKQQTLKVSKMGSLGNEPEFKHLTINPLHPTFAAEVEGLDFRNLSDEQFKEIFAAMAKVSTCSTNTVFKGWHGETD
jgi:hypothetical protein